MTRIILLLAVALTALSGHGRDPHVTYLESTGNNGNFRIFSVSTPVKAIEMSVVINGKAEKVKLQPEEQACLEVMNAILFDGVDNYNDGMPLVANPNDAFAKSLVNPKSKTFMTYFKDIQLENSPTNKQAFHYIVELNNFNLMRLLKMRGSI